MDCFVSLKVSYISDCEFVLSQTTTLSGLRKTYLVMRAITVPRMNMTPAARNSRFAFRRPFSGATRTAKIMSKRQTAASSRVILRTFRYDRSRNAAPSPANAKSPKEKKRLNILSIMPLATTIRL